MSCVGSQAQLILCGDAAAGMGRLGCGVAEQVKLIHSGIALFSMNYHIQQGRNHFPEKSEF